MDKRENLLQFLDYGGNELFSSLMESDSDRPQALDRMCILLRKAVIFGKLFNIFCSFSKRHNYLLFPRTLQISLIYCQIINNRLFFV